MTLSITHSTVVDKPENPAYEVSADPWNAPHVIAAGAATLLGNPTGSPGNASEITLGTGLSFSGTALNAATASSSGTSGTLQASNGAGGFAAATGVVYAASGINLSVTAQNNGDVPLKVSGTASASADIQQWAIGSTVYTSIDSQGGGLKFAAIADLTVPSTYSFLKNYNSGGMVMGSASGKTYDFNIGIPTYMSLNRSGACLLVTPAATTQIGLIISPLSSNTADQLQSQDHNGNIQIKMTAKGSLVVGFQAIATNATDGFVYLASSAGAPTGTPTTQTGTVPIEIDTTNSKFWAYIGGVWKGVVLT